ncbi:hypothetical protein BH11ARM1_BH11ARM1_08130 [soil metagenome]
MCWESSFGSETHPSIGAQGFRNIGSGYKKLGELKSVDQALDYGKATYSATGIHALRVITRGYPKNLSVSHAGANLTHEEIWTFKNDKPVRQRRTLLNTAYNAMDAFYGALARKDRVAVLKACLNKAVFDQVWKLQPKAYGDTPNLGSYDDDGTIFELDSLMTEFHFVKHQGVWVIAKLVKVTKPWFIE